MQNTAPKSFADLGVASNLVTALKGMDRENPFPIQEDTLPDTLAGRDVLGRGKTGSGKTLAFAIPLVQRLSDGQRSGRLPGGLVLAPTRELATQITATVKPLADAAGLKVTTIFGGVSQRPQETALREGVDIIVACPGRLDDLMRQGIADLKAVEVTVIDEADHMADLGFLPVVTRILSKTPTGGQRLLFSATLDNGVDKLVRKFLQNEVMHSVDEANSPVAAMTHHLFEVSADDKAQLIRRLASGKGRRILFTRTKHQAKKLAKQLTASGIPAVDLHGNLSQNARDRNLAAFGDGSVRVLVATDVAARGVHVDNVELVVHVDPPMEHKAYLHRSGRTARAGSAGDVATVMLPTQRRDTLALLRKAQIQVEPQSVTADSAAVVELVGPEAAHVKPVPGGPGSGNEIKQQQGGGKSQGANARRKRAAREGDVARGGRGRGGSSRGDSGRTADARGTEAGGRGRNGSGRAASGAGRSGSSRGGSSVAWSSTGGGSQQRGARSGGPRRAQRPAGR